MSIKKILTVTIGMAGGYPIDGKPEKTAEKMPPEIMWRWIALFALMALVVVVAYFAIQTPAKIATDAAVIGADGKVPSSGNPPVIGTATPTQQNRQETKNSYEPVYVYNPNIKWDWRSDYTAVAPAEPNDPKKKIVNGRIWLKQCSFGDMTGKICYSYKYIDIGP